MHSVFSRLPPGKRELSYLIVDFSEKRHNCMAVQSRSTQPPHTPSIVFISFFLLLFRHTGRTMGGSFRNESIHIVRVPKCATPRFLAIGFPILHRRPQECREGFFFPLIDPLLLAGYASFFALFCCFFFRDKKSIQIGEQWRPLFSAAHRLSENLRSKLCRGAEKKKSGKTPQNSG